MSLRRGIEAIRRRRKELVVFNAGPEDPIVGELASYFAAQNVRVTGASTASGAPEIAVLSGAETVLATVAVSTLRELVGGAPTDPDGVGINDTAYEPVLEHLKETTFTSYDREQLLYASREIEDRARRVGTGTIHAGFQRLSTMETQAHIYADLARRGVEVHAYGLPDAAVSGLDAGRIHPEDTDEIADTWFVVFDGGGDDSQKSALLAEERESDQFYGAWTYDAAIVDGAAAYLDGAYLDGGRPAARGD